MLPLTSGGSFELLPPDADVGTDAPPLPPVEVAARVVAQSICGAVTTIEQPRADWVKNFLLLIPLAFMGKKGFEPICSKMKI